MEEGKVKILWNTTLEEVLGDKTGVTGMRVKNTQSGETQDMAVHGVFVAIGHKPNTGIFEGQLAMKGGYLSVQSGTEGNATPKPASKACLRRVMSWITFTAKPLPPLAQVAWQPSMRKNTSIN